MGASPLMPVLALHGADASEELRGIATGTFYDDNFGYNENCVNSMKGNLRLTGQFRFGEIWRGSVAGNYVGDSCSPSNPPGVDTITRYRFHGSNPLNGSSLTGSCDGTAVFGTSACRVGVEP